MLEEKWSTLFIVNLMKRTKRARVVLYGGEEEFWATGPREGEAGVSELILIKVLETFFREIRLTLRSIPSRTSTNGISTALIKDKHQGGNSGKPVNLH